MVRAASTLQDVHPDQLRSLWTTADLVLEEILSLQTDTKKSETYQNVHVSFHFSCCFHARSALFSYPGSLQAADLPVESCWALQSCNTQT